MWHCRESKRGYRSATLAGAAALILVCFVFCSSALALSSVNVPVDHWSYAALDKLEGFGLIHSRIYGTKPYTRLEVARLVQEALGSEAYQQKKLPPLLIYFLEKFQKEFKNELAETGASGRSTGNFVQPITEAQAQYAYVEGEPRRFTGFPNPGGNFGIRATEGTPLLPNNEGIIYTEHSNFSFRFASSARAYDIFSAYVEPIFIARENRGNRDNLDDFDVDLFKGYGKISPWNIEFQAGRDTIVLGQGYHGTLLLSGNAPPLDMLKLSNPEPVVLPWYFRHLGLLKYTFFVAQLEDDRDFARTNLVGMHFVIKPHPLFEFGANWAFLCNGEGRPSVSFLDVISLFQIGNVRDKVDELASVDARFRMPWFRNTELYAEFGGEDSPGPRWYEFMFRDVGYLVGFYVPSITDDGRTDFRLEYAHNAFDRDRVHVGFWYGHTIYKSGYTFDGLIIGHPMGPDASDLFVRSTHFITDKWKIGLDFDRMERGLTLGPSVEKINTIGTDLTYDINEWLSISGRYSYGAISNFDMVRGDDRNAQLFMTGIKATF